MAMLKSEGRGGGGGNKLWGGLYTGASSFSHTEVLRNVVSLIKMSFHQVQSVSDGFAFIDCFSKLVICVVHPSTHNLFTLYIPNLFLTFFPSPLTQ